MPSANKTPLGLNQWQANEYPKMVDFNEDNRIIDEKITELQSGSGVKIYTVAELTDPVENKIYNVKIEENTSTINEKSVYKENTSESVTLKAGKVATVYYKQEAFYAVANADVVDNLESNSKDSALSANQGRILKEKVDQAFQSASEGKNKIAQALTGKGIEASDDDTFPILAEKIGEIKKASGNARPEDVLMGKTFSSDLGADIQGSIDLSKIGKILNSLTLGKYNNSGILSFNAAVNALTNRNIIPLWDNYILNLHNYITFNQKRAIFFHSYTNIPNASEHNAIIKTGHLNHVPKPYYENLEVYANILYVQNLKTGSGHEFQPKHYFIFSDPIFSGDIISSIKGFDKANSINSHSIAYTFIAEESDILGFSSYFGRMYNIDDYNNVYKSLKNRMLNLGQSKLFGDVTRYLQKNKKYVFCFFMSNDGVSSYAQRFGANPYALFNLRRPEI